MPDETVVLWGREASLTHRAVALLSRLPIELRLVGGLAVMCRVGMPHRATLDIDTVARHLDQHHAALAAVAVTTSAVGTYRMAHDVKLDVIDVAPGPADELAQRVENDGPASDDEMNALAHAWAHDAATAMDIVVLSDSGDVLVEARNRLVASAAGLGAMKAMTVPLRRSSRPEKRKSDLYDLARLLTTCVTIGADVSDMPPLLAVEFRRRLTDWFVDEEGRDRTYRDIRQFDDPRVDLDEVADVVVDLAI